MLEAIGNLLFQIYIQLIYTETWTGNYIFMLIILDTVDKLISTMEIFYYLYVKHGQCQLLQKTIPATFVN